MRPIPPKMRQEMADDSYYQVCAWHRKKHPNKRLQWHHNLIHAGRQVNRKWAILPLCQEIHEIVSRREVREYLDWVMLSRAPENELEEFGLTEKRNRLRKIYENQKNRPILHDNQNGNLATIP